MKCDPTHMVHPGIQTHARPEVDDQVVQAIAFEVAAHGRLRTQPVQRRPDAQVSQDPQAQSWTEVDDRVLPGPAEQGWNRNLAGNLPGFVDCVGQSGTDILQRATSRPEERPAARAAGITLTDDLAGIVN